MHVPDGPGRTWLLGWGTRVYGRLQPLGRRLSAGEMKRERTDQSRWAEPGVGVVPEFGRCCWNVNLRSSACLFGSGPRHYDCCCCRCCGCLQRNRILINNVFVFLLFVLCKFHACVAFDGWCVWVLLGPSVPPAKQVCLSSISVCVCVALPVYSGCQPTRCGLRW